MRNGKTTRALTKDFQPAASDAPGLEETRFASPIEMEELQKQLEKDAAARNAPGAPRPMRR